MNVRANSIRIVRMVELDSLNSKYKDCMKEVERLKMDLRYTEVTLSYVTGIIKIGVIINFPC